MDRADRFVAELARQSPRMQPTYRPQHAWGPEGDEGPPTKSPHLVAPHQDRAAKPMLAPHGTPARSGATTAVRVRYYRERIGSRLAWTRNRTGGPNDIAPQRLARTRPFVLRLPRRREKPLSEAGVAIFLAIYALGFYAVGFHDPGYLLLSWLMTGPLAVTVYLTFDGRGSLMNPYTLFFAAIVLGSFAAYVLGGAVV